MPKIDLSMLNQRQTPAFYADVLANRPAAGFIGRIFVSTNTYAFYRDNGTGWDLIGGPGTGTVTGSGTAGQVTYWDGASSITGSNNLFWDSANNRLGINNTTPGASLDIHSAVSSIAQFNQTVATNNSLLVLQNSGSALWRLGNYYNAGANDFGVFDVIGAIQPLTIKKTSGQVLIGTSTVGSGKLVVASASSDNGIQIVGAIAPSLRIDSAETGATKRIGIGLATAVNNFIQNSQNLDMCIFNGSTSAAGNMLFGIYDTGLTNVQEAARISAARNFLIGTITDAGQKLQVSGTGIFSSTLQTTNIGINFAPQTDRLFVYNGSGTNVLITAQQDGTGDLIRLNGNGGANRFNITQSGAATFSSTLTTYGALYVGQTGVTNGIINSNDGMYFNIDADASGSTPEFMFGKGRSTSGSGGTTLMTITNAGNVGIGSSSPSVLLHLSKTSAANQLWLQSTTGTNAAYMNFINSGGNNYIGVDNSTGTGLFATGGAAYGFGIVTESAYPLLLGTNNTERARITSSGNLLIGTTTDNGNKLQVNGILTATSLRSQTVGAFGFNTANNGEFQIYATAIDGMLIAGRGSTNDLILLNKNGNDVMRVPTGTTTANFLGSVNIANTVTAAVGIASTHKVSILINGVQYYLLASNV